MSPIAQTSSCACVAGDCAGAYLTGTQAPNQVLALWPPIWRQHLLRGARASPGRLGTRDPAYPVHAAPKKLTRRRRAAGAFVTGATAADQVRSPGAAPWDAARGARAPPGSPAALARATRRTPCTRRRRSSPAGGARQAPSSRVPRLQTRCAPPPPPCPAPGEAARGARAPGLQPWHARPGLLRARGAGEARPPAALHARHGCRPGGGAHPQADA